MNDEEELKVTIGRYSKEWLESQTDDELVRISGMVRKWKIMQNQNA